jgi:hypothetical protein
MTTQGSELGGNIERSVGALGGEVTLSDLFPPGWMRAHTDAEDIGQFVRESDFDVDSAEDFYDLPEVEWNDYVAANTEFDDWGGMLADALDAFIEREGAARREREPA